MIDLSAVGYVDSTTIGCLMDLYRQATNANGVLKLAGVQKRVETMLTMTGAHHFLQVFADEPSALASLWSLGNASRITTASGTQVELDGDVLAVIETVSRPGASPYTRLRV